MADASCGPSNAFKGLARHIEQDRSHQQDRVAPGSQHAAQSFRSTLPNTGLTDQFSAFQQQNAAIPHHPAASWKPFPHPTDLPSYSALEPAFTRLQSNQLPTSSVLNASSSWVNDFQRMSFSNAQPGPFHSQPAQGPALGRLGPADTLPLDLAPAQHPNVPYFPPQAVGPYSVNHQLGAFQANQPPQLIDNHHLAAHPQIHADLEQEFEDAMNEWMLQNGPEAETSGQNELDADFSEPTPHEEAPVESRDQETELARAAQQLVDSVADNDSEKFKNSEFLALMRRIASQQLTVQGNNLVENPKPPSTAAGSEPHTINATSATEPGPSS